jgi:hypothetical protein
MCAGAGGVGMWSSSSWVNEAFWAEGVSTRAPDVIRGRLTPRRGSHQRVKMSGPSDVRFIVLVDG